MRLIVYIDSDREDKGRDSYLKAISSKIKDLKIIDVAKGKTNERININSDRILLIEPIGINVKRQIKRLFEKQPQLDIEGRFTGKLTITAEAILRVMQDVEGKEIIICNQSDIIGKPLALELMHRGANVHSLNSTGKIANINRCYWFITASGQDDFKHKNTSMKGFKKIIDLSDDTDYKRAIRRLPTVDVLQDRLRGGKYDKKIKRTVHWL